MAKTITIFWKSNSQYEASPLRVSIESWRVLQREGVRILNLRQEDGLRHEIPLDNVLYWSVDTAVTNDSVGDESLDRYCNSCKVYFDSGQFHGHPIATHDVRRTCCGASPQHDHHPACTQGTFQSQQRIGTITDISEDDDGLSFRASFDPSNPASPFFGLPGR